MTFDPRKPVQTETGIPVILLSVVGRDPWPLVGYVGASSVISHWENNGRSREGDGDLINVPEPKRSGEFWMNVYQLEGRLSFERYSDEIEAKETAKNDTRCLACVRVSWTKGEGLDK